MDFLEELNNYADDYDSDPDDAVEFVPYEKQERSKYSYGYMNEDGLWTEANEEEEEINNMGFFDIIEDEIPFNLDSDEALYALNPGLKDLIRQNISNYKKEYNNKYEF